MSLIRCDICKEIVDSDEYPEIFREELDHKIICNWCWDTKDWQDQKER